MQVNILNQTNSVVNNYLAEIRDVKIQKDPLRFRRNLQRIGSMMAYEVSKTLNYAEKEVHTPLGIARVNQPSDDVVVGTIFRAGLPMHQGVLDVFDRAESCFISAYRKYEYKENFSIQLEYVATPELEGKVLLLTDPMLATGYSIEATVKAIKRFGQPSHTHIMCIIGSRAGVDFLCREMKGEPITLWVAAVDEELNSHKYIVPGLGDAGDLAFGEKL